MENEKLIEGLRVEQSKIASQLLGANPQWRELQGAINALQGAYVLPEAAQTAGAAQADGATQEQGEAA